MEPEFFFDHGGARKSTLQEFTSARHSHLQDNTRTAAAAAGFGGALAAAAAGGMFGGAAPAANADSSGGGMFGGAAPAASADSSGGGMFGAAPPAASVDSGGGLFGGAAPTAAAPACAAGNMFEQTWVEPSPPRGDHSRLNKMICTKHQEEEAYLVEQHQQPVQTAVVVVCLVEGSPFGGGATPCRRVPAAGGGRDPRYTVTMER